MTTIRTTSALILAGTLAILLAGQEWFCSFIMVATAFVTGLWCAASNVILRANERDR